MSLDLAFVVDVTGSMGAWLEACKANIRAIAKDIVPRIHKQYPGLQLAVRYALVGYRDVGDNPQFEEQGFTEDVAVLEDKVRFVFAWSGV
jgi:hypothetical protein